MGEDDKTRVPPDFRSRFRTVTPTLATRFMWEFVVKKPNPKWAPRKRRRALAPAGASTAAPPAEDSDLDDDLPADDGAAVSQHTNNHDLEAAALMEQDLRNKKQDNVLKALRDASLSSPQSFSEFQGAASLSNSECLPDAALTARGRTRPSLMVRTKPGVRAGVPFCLSIALEGSASPRTKQFLLAALPSHAGHRCFSRSCCASAQLEQFRRQRQR